MCRGAPFSLSTPLGIKCEAKKNVDFFILTACYVKSSSVTGKHWESGNLVLRHSDSIFPLKHKHATINTKRCAFVSHSRRRNIKYWIFPCPRSSNEAKRDVEFRNSTHNASRIRWKVGHGSVLIERGAIRLGFLSAYPAKCEIQREAYMYI